MIYATKTSRRMFQMEYEEKIEQLQQKMKKMRQEPE